MFSSWVIKFERIPYEPTDKYSIEFMKKSNKIIEEMNVISIELGKEENKANLELTKRFSKKLNELILISTKYKEYKKNI